MSFEMDHVGTSHALSRDPASLHPLVFRESRTLRSLIALRENVLLPFKKRLIPWFDISMGDVLMVVVFAAFCAAFLVWDASEAAWANAAAGDAKELSKSIGKLSHFIIAFLLVPLPHTNFLFSLFGCSFERAIRFHRWLGNILFFVLVVHVVLMVVYWVTTKQYTMQGGLSATVKYEIFKLDNIWGEIAFCCITIMFLLSFGFIRRRFFEVFYKPHVVLFVPFMVFGALHEKWEQMLLLCLIPLVLYAFDVIFRFSLYILYGRCEILSWKRISDNYLKVEFRTRLGVRPGQFVFLWVPAAARLQTHPFSLSSVRYNHAMGDATCTVHMKMEGRWARRVMEAFESSLNPRTLRIHASGPYGQLSAPPLDTYPCVVLVGGGIGITPLLASVNALSASSLADQHSPLEQIVLLWTLRDVALLLDQSEMLQELARDDRVRACVFLTGGGDAEVVAAAVEEDLEGGQRFRSLAATPVPDIPGVEVVSGRPDLSSELSRSYADCEAIGGSSMAVVTCGPAPFMQEVGAWSCKNSCAARVSIEFHQETFEL